MINKKGALIAGIVILLLALGTLYNYVTRETFFIGNKASFGAIDNSIYYEDGIDTNDIDIIGKILVEFELFTGDERFIVKLEQNELGYHIYLPMLVDYWDDEDFITSIKHLEDRLEDRVGTRFQTTLVDGNDTDKHMEIQR